MATINGMPAADARALDALAVEACTIVERFAPAITYAALRTLEIQVGTDWSKSGSSMTYETPRTLFATLDTWTAGLRDRTREARTTAVALALELDPEAAAELFGRAALLRTEESHQVSYEGGLVRVFWSRWQESMARLPASFSVDLFLRGKFRFDALTDVQVAAIPLDALAEAIDRVDLDQDEVDRLLAEHGDLQTPDQRHVFAESVFGPSWSAWRSLATTRPCSRRCGTSSMLAGPAPISAGTRTTPTSSWPRRSGPGSRSTRPRAPPDSDTCSRPRR